MIGLLISVLQLCGSALVKLQNLCKHHMPISIELNPKLLQEERAKLHAINTAKQFKVATCSLEKLKALIKQEMHEAYVLETKIEEAAIWLKG